MGLRKKRRILRFQIFQCFLQVLFLNLNLSDPLFKLLFFLQVFVLDFNVFWTQSFALLGLSVFSYGNGLIKLEGSIILLQLIVLKAHPVDEKGHESWSL